MKTNNDSAVSALNELIKIGRDGERGYQLAGDKEKDRVRGALYFQYSNQRKRLVNELKEEIRSLGGKPYEGGTVAGAFHRGWMNIENAVKGHDAQAIVNECEQGEDAAVKAYEEALQKPLPDSSRRLVEQQFQEVREAHDHISDLKHKYESEKNTVKNT